MKGEVFDAVFKNFLLLFLNSKYIMWYNNDISSVDNNSNKNCNGHYNDLFTGTLKNEGRWEFVLECFVQQ